MPSQFREAFASFGFDIRHHVQCTDLGSQLKATREALGHSVPDVARVLRVARYKVRSAENGQFRSLGRPSLQRYVAYLQLTDWFEAWQRNNPQALREASRPKPVRASAGAPAASRNPKKPGPGAA